MAHRVVHPHVCAECGGGYSNLAMHLRYCEGSKAPPTPPKEDAHSPPAQLALDIGCVISEETMRANVAGDLADMRFERGMDEPDIQMIKEKVRAWELELNETRVSQLRSLVREGVTDEELHSLLDFDIFKGLATTRQELAYAKRNLPYIEPRINMITKTDIVVSFAVSDLIVRKMQHDMKFRQTVLAKSNEWKRGDKWCKPPERLSDISDGIKARYHPHLMRPATEEEEHDVRVLWIFNCDDIEVQSLRPGPSPARRGPITYQSRRRP